MELHLAELNDFASRVPQRLIVVLEVLLAHFGQGFSVVDAEDERVCGKSEKAMSKHAECVTYFGRERGPRRDS